MDEARAGRPLMFDIDFAELGPGLRLLDAVIDQVIARAVAGYAAQVVTWRSLASFAPDDLLLLNKPPENQPEHVPPELQELAPHPPLTRGQAARRRLDALLVQGDALAPRIIVIDPGPGRPLTTELSGPAGGG
jgi:hypothetical protein